MQHSVIRCNAFLAKYLPLLSFVHVLPIVTCANLWQGSVLIELPWAATPVIQSWLDLDFCFADSIHVNINVNVNNVCDVTQPRMMSNHRIDVSKRCHLVVQLARRRFGSLTDWNHQGFLIIMGRLQEKTNRLRYLILSIEELFSRTQNNALQWVHR